LVDGKPKADSSGKAGINFTILEYANTGHKTQTSSCYRCYILHPTHKLYYISETVGQFCKQSTWPWLVSFPLTFFTWFLCLALLCLGDYIQANTYKVETMQKRIQIVTNANTQIINEIVLMIFINTTSPSGTPALGMCDIGWFWIFGLGPLLVFLLSKFRLWAYLMKVILETRHAHLDLYLRFYLRNVRIGF
jgi:hypothetical protein